ncbi:MAG: DNA alkylation repair protein [Patescibacteria group bacterium]
MPSKKKISPIDLISTELKSKASRSRSSILQRFFKTAPGQYGAGDVFLGLTVPLQRQIAKQYADLDRPALQSLLNSKFHEFRLVALLIMVFQYEGAKEREDKKSIVDFYLRNTNRINNWDLVDLSVYKILGDFLCLTGETGRLDRLAASRNLWERRMAMVATYAFIKAGRSAETFWIAKKLLKDKEDLIHKAVGWMLRETGKRVSEAELKRFLDRHYRAMPRTALRYAIERLEPRTRERYLAR